jgi:hypothetical protein
MQAKQGNHIINPLKKKRKKPTEKDWRGIMDLRTELALIPDPRIVDLTPSGRQKNKHGIQTRRRKRWERR